jgi:hypothetical protein
MTGSTSLISFPSERVVLSKDVDDEQVHRVWFVFATSSKRILHADPEVLIHKDAMSWMDRYMRAGYKVTERGLHDWSKRESLQNL